MRSLWRYLRTQTWPRRWDIACQVQVVAAVAAGIAVAVFGGRIGLDDLKVDTLVTGVVAYAALALGACLTGLTAVLTFPDRPFVHYLAGKKRADKPEANAYRDLIFVFSWTAIAHWAVIALALVTFLGLGNREVPIISGDRLVGGGLIVLLVATLVYAMAQLLVAIITLSEVAEVYIAWILRPKGERSAAPERATGRGR